MDQLVVKASARTESGKYAAKKLRETGCLPAVMYNSKGEAAMLSVNELEFTKVWKAATATTLVTLDVEGQGKKLAFIKATDYNIISNTNLHVDFHVIDEDKVIRTDIKIQMTGNPAGVRDGGKLVKSCEVITISALPKDLPVRMTTDISNLAIGQKYTVKDVAVPAGVTIITDGETQLAFIRSAK